MKQSYSTSPKQHSGEKNYKCCRNKLLWNQILVILGFMCSYILLYPLEVGVKLKIGGKNHQFLKILLNSLLDKHLDCKLNSRMMDIISVISKIFVSINLQPNKSSSSVSLKSRPGVFKFLNYPTRTLELERTICPCHPYFAEGEMERNNRKQNNRKFKKVIGRKRIKTLVSYHQTQWLESFSIFSPI